ncbi:MAG: hypothetical protein R6V58_01320 [Planctomycetota bacterium]
MPRIKETEFRSLATHQAPHSVSILMPTHRAGMAIRQDPIRFKNLLRDAEEQLERTGLRDADARAKLEPLAALIDDEGFWRRQSDGLAVYVDDREHIFRVPLALEETALVGRRFHLKPLLPLLQDDSRFYVLALGQNSVRFFEASRHGIRSVPLEDAPENLAAALRLDGPQEHVEFHTGTQSHGPAEGRPAVYHGQGAGVDEREKKKRLAEYCHQIDASVYRKIGDQRVPLVLAAAEPLLSIYRQANRYPALGDHVVRGNYEQTSPKDLHAAAVDVVRDEFGAERRAALGRYQRLAGTDRVSSDLEDILRAANNRQVETLFVSVDVTRWGGIDESQQTVDIHDEREPGDEDLLNVAALLTAHTGGAVFATARDEVPEDSDAVAVFRFSPSA